MNIMIVQPALPAPLLLQPPPRYPLQLLGTPQVRMAVHAELDLANSIRMQPMISYRPPGQTLYCSLQPQPHTGSPYPQYPSAQRAGPSC